MLPEMPFTVVLQGGGCGSGILWMLSLSACRLWFCFCGSCYDLIFAIACSCCLRFLWFPFFWALQLFCVRVLRWVVCCGCCGFCDSHPAAVFEDVAVVVVAVVVEVWLVVVFFIVVEAFACGLTMFFSFSSPSSSLRPGLSISCCCCCQCRTHNYTGTVVVDVNVTMVF